MPKPKYSVLTLTPEKTINIHTQEPPETPNGVEMPEGFRESWKSPIDADARYERIINAFSKTYSAVTEFTAADKNGRRVMMFAGADDAKTADHAARAEAAEQGYSITNAKPIKAPQQ